MMELQFLNPLRLSTAVPLPALAPALNLSQDFMDA